MKLFSALLAALLFNVNGFAAEYIIVNQPGELTYNDSAIQNENSDVNPELEKEKELIKSRNEILTIREDSERNVLFGFLLMLVFLVGFIFAGFKAKQKLDNTLRRQSAVIQAQRRRLRLSSQNVRTAREKLLQAEKMALLGQVTSGIAHEIHNPINYVSGGIDNLSYSLNNILFLIRNPAEARADNVDELETETRLLLKTVTNGIDRVVRIVSSIRTISNPSQAGDFTHIRLDECLESALVILGSKIRDTNTIVKMNYSASPAIVYGSATQLAQVFLNVLDNAIQAMEGLKEKNILIETYEKDEYVIVNITDTGPGIPESIQMKIMEPFFTTRTTGTGLGLSISSKIIENHGGKLSCVNEKGMGAKFVIQLKTSGSHKSINT